MNDLQALLITVFHPSDAKKITAVIQRLEQRIASLEQALSSDMKKKQSGGQHE